MNIDQLLTRIHNQLDGNADNESERQRLIREAKHLVQQHPEYGTRLGPLIGKLLRQSVHPPNIEMTWCALLNGRIAIGHRPKVKTLETMKTHGATHILTLLSEKEGAREIEKAARKAGLHWLWLPLPGAEPPVADARPQIQNLFEDCAQQLKQGASIYIHCSAGIHRTGMIAYALLRFVGKSSAEASAFLSELREQTGNEVGAHRKAWGDMFCAPI